MYEMDKLKNVPKTPAPLVITDDDDVDLKLKAFLKPVSSPQSNVPPGS